MIKNGTPKWVRHFGAVVCCVLAVSGSLRAAAAEQVGSSASASVRTMVEAFLLHLGDHDFDAVAVDMAPKAIVIVTRERAGDWSNSFQTGDEWLAALRKNPNPVTFREPLTNVTVTVDSDHLAYLRADFTVVRDGAVQSHGVDQFTLVRESGGWKIAVVAYTSMPAK